MSSATPLTGLRVLTFADAAVPALGTFLAGLGARVERYVPRDVEPAVDPLTARLHARGKVDRPWPSEVDAVDLDEADVLLLPPGDDPLGPVARLAVRYPRLVIAVVSAFGTEGERSAWVGSEAVYQALNGALSRSGEPGGTPLLPPGDIVTHAAAYEIAWAILATLYARRGGPRPDRAAVLDCPVFEAGNVGLDPAYGMVGSGTPEQHSGFGRPDAAHIYPIFPVSDGFIRVCLLAPAHWEAMLDWLGRPDGLCDPALRGTLERQAQRGLVLPALERLFAPLTAGSAVAECRDRGIPAAEVRRLADVVADPQYRTDGILRTEEAPDGQCVLVADGLVRIDGERAVAPSGAPRPDPAPEDSAPDNPAPDNPAPDNPAPENPAPEDLGSVDAARRPAPAGRRGPLAGLTVVDLGIIVAGAEVGLLFAELGARVIHVENREHPDGMRRGDLRSPTTSLQRGHRGKELIALDLQSQRGREIVHELVARADVVTSNFKPGTVDKLGLDITTLRTVNPRIVCLESSAFGTSGPWRKAMGYGPLVRAATGMTWLWRESVDSHYFADGITIYPDHVVARIGAAATLACLLGRDGAEAGAQVTVAQSEATLVQLGELLARVHADPTAVLPPGRVRGSVLGQTVFPAAGDDQWCVVDPRTRAQLDALTAVLRADGAVGREPDATGVLTAVRGWVAGQHPDHVMCRLQESGVPAGRMQRTTELPTAAAMGGAQRYLTVDERPEGGPLLAERFPIRSTDLPTPPLPVMPEFGAHTRAVLAELGYSPERVEELFRAGVAQDLHDPLAG